VRVAFFAVGGRGHPFTVLSGDRELRVQSTPSSEWELCNEQATANVWIFTSLWRSGTKDVFYIRTRPADNTVFFQFSWTCLQLALLRVSFPGSQMQTAMQQLSFGPPALAPFDFF
jgi:hypothetical protein